MSLDNLIQPKIELEIFGEKREINFTLRNFSAIKLILDISEVELINGLFEGDVDKIIAAIWGSTLIFDEFDPKDPIKIKSQLSLEKLYSLNLPQLKEINEKLVRVIIDSMPKNEEANTEKKQEAHPQTK